MSFDSLLNFVWQMKRNMMLVRVSEFAPMDLSKLSHVDSLIYLESGIRSCHRINFEL